MCDARSDGRIHFMVHTPIDVFMIMFVCALQMEFILVHTLE